MVEQGITTMFYLTHPLEILNFRNGGLGIPGAVLGGFLAVLLYTRRHDLSIAKWTDITAPGLALAQAIGRWGNFFNQEVYGRPTNLPWKLYIEPARRLQEFATVEYYHPLFLYEFFWNLLNAGVLIFLSRRYKKWLRPGDLFLIYLIFYPVGRFFLEFLRLDPSPVAGINVNQTLMAVIAILASLALIIRHRSSSAPARSVRLRESARLHNGGAAVYDAQGNFIEEENKPVSSSSLSDEDAEQRK
jgi:phosphatidylglycerol:prolipoprotein diacylglycerol transferase